MSVAGKSVGCEAVDCPLMFFRGHREKTFLAQRRKGAKKNIEYFDGLEGTLKFLNNRKLVKQGL